jgi:hypothetical protein
VQHRYLHKKRKAGRHDASDATKVKSFLKKFITARLRLFRIQPGGSMDIPMHARDHSENMLYFEQLRNDFTDTGNSRSFEEAR